MIYLDNASTTRIDPKVLEAMLPYLKENFGNPGSIYSLGREAKAAVEQAREQVADFINADPSEIVFTSGGTESNNTVINLVASIGSSPGIVVSKIEHDSVLSPIRHFNMAGKIRMFELPSDSGWEQGKINPKSIQNILEDKKDIRLVSAMYMNNETGVENPVKEIGKLCHEHNVLFHTDCVQAATCCPIDVKEIACDFLSLSSHKIYGPKGVGCLYVRNGSLDTPLIRGGVSQEFGFRGGTENVAGIVGFGKACELMTQRLRDIDVHVSVLKQLFYNELLKYPGLSTECVHVNGNIMHHGKILSLRIDGVEGETLVLAMDAAGVCISAGSACRSHESEPSEALLSYGLTPDEARQTVRISFGKDNTTEEVIEAAHLMGIMANGILKLNSEQEM